MAAPSSATSLTAMVTAQPHAPPTPQTAPPRTSVSAASNQPSNTSIHQRPKSKVSPQNLSFRPKRSGGICFSNILRTRLRTISVGAHTEHKRSEQTRTKSHYLRRSFLARGSRSRISLGDSSSRPTIEPAHQRFSPRNPLSQAPSQRPPIFVCDSRLL